jgi:hypothetical protein
MRRHDFPENYALKETIGIEITSWERNYRKENGSGKALMIALFPVGQYRPVSTCAGAVRRRMLNWRTGLTETGGEVG